MGTGPDRAINFPQSPSMDVGRSVGGGEAESDHRNPRRSLARRPTDAQLHLFRKRKTNALYFRESDRH